MPTGIACMLKLIHCLGLCLLLESLVAAGEFNPVLSPGDVAPAWSNLPGVDGEDHSLANLPADRLVLVVFTCNSCPVARDYEGRLNEFARRHADQVEVIAINTNFAAADELDKMRTRAREQSFGFAYLKDKTQEVGRAYGASGTPEFFLLSKAVAEAGDSTVVTRTLLYQGAMDDHTDAAQAKVNYLDAAVTSALANEPIATPETRAQGCRIRYKRVRPAAEQPSP
ncbi:MAG: thioredoxin family protein [Planctomycetaceae bacterium]